MSRMAASKAVLAAAMTSAAFPVTAASSSDCTTNVCAAVATKPSMCDPRSLQGNHTLYVCCARKVLSNPLEAVPVSFPPVVGSLLSCAVFWCMRLL